MLKNSALVLIVCALGLALTAVGVALSDTGPPGREAVRTVDAFTPASAEIVNAVYTQERLWILRETGELWSLSPSATETKREVLPEPAIGLCARPAGPVVVTRPLAADPTLNIRRWTPEGWSLVDSLSSQGEPLIAVECGDADITLLTSFRLIQGIGARSRVLKLSRPLPAEARRVAALATSKRVLVGYDMGEFGGGLHAVDRMTGQVGAVMGGLTFSGDCLHQLDAACDNVTGIAKSPTRPDCVIVTLTHLHMIDRAAALQICGDKALRLAPHSCPVARPSDLLDTVWGDDDGRLECASRLYDPTPTPAGIVASRPGGLTFLDEDGRANGLPMPQLKTFGDFEVSFASPHYVVLQSTSPASRRRDYIGPVPLIVAR